MQAFTHLNALVVPLDRANIDTDAIIPKQFLKSIQRTGFGVNLFDQWRYLDRGEPGQDCSNRPLNPDFILNQARYQGAKILITQQNFGCGSSREHAPWALLDYGIQAIIAPSYADIFYNNCFKNGILPIIQSQATIDQLIQETSKQTGYQLDINLNSQQITSPSGQSYPFDIDPSRKHSLLNGLDDIGITLKEAASIRAYETQHRQQTPWLF